MKVKHLDHLNLSVSSFNDSLNFYQKLFGFEVVEYHHHDPRFKRTWGVLRSGEALLCLYEYPERKLESDNSQHRVNHFSFRITDAATFEALAKDLEVEIQYGGAVQYPHSQSWYLNDPSGYEIEVVCWNDDRIRFNSEA